MKTNADLQEVLKEKDLVIERLNADIEQVGKMTENKLGNLSVELEEFRSLYEKAQDDLRVLASEKGALLDQVQGREAEASAQSEAWQAEVHQLRSQLAESAEVGERYAASVSEHATLQALVDSLRAENSQLVLQSKEQTELTESVLNEKDQYLAELEDLLTINEKMKEDERALQAELEALKSAAVAAQAQGQATDEGEVRELRTMNDDLKGKNQNLLAETDSLRDQIYEINKQVQELVSEKSQERQERESLEQNYAQLQARYMQANDALSQLKGDLKTGQSQFTNKKDEDDLYDVEAALVSGGSSGFMPMAGLLRSIPAALQLKLFILAAEAVDKVTIAVHTKPGTRLAFWLYTLVLHLYVFLSIIF